MKIRKVIAPAICLLLGVAVGLTLARSMGGEEPVTERADIAVRSDITVVVESGAIDLRDEDGNSAVPLLVDGTFYIPVHALGEALYRQVAWHDDTSIIELFEPRGGWTTWTDRAPDTPEAPPPPEKDVVVSNAEELYAAIASGTCITLKEGVYDLSTIYSEGREPYRNTHTLAVEGVEGLILQAEAGAEVELVTPDLNSDVLFFSNCNGITLRGIKAGHSRASAYASDAGVVHFEYSANITVEDCYFYGGSTGMQINDCITAEVKNTTVTDCSLYGVFMRESWDIRFTDCKFVDNRTYGNVIAGYFISARFTGCEISGNKQLQWGAVDVNGYDVLLEGCVFRDNALADGHYAPVLAGYGIRVKDCVVEKAGFNLGHWREAEDLGGNMLS